MKVKLNVELELPDEYKDYSDAELRSLIYDEFIDFDSAEEAVKWWMGLIKNSRHYTKAYASRHDYKRFYNRITAWATDPKYAEKVKRVYRQLKPKSNQIKLAAANGGRLETQVV